MRINSKDEFFAQQQLFRCGNHFQTFSTVEAALAGCTTGGIYIRGPRPQWPHMVPWCPLEQLPVVAADISRRTAGESMQFVEVPPFGEPRRLNAELAIADGHVADWRYLLTWGTSSEASLRTDLLANGQTALGLAAWDKITTTLPPEDVDMVRGIWELFPTATLELSVYTRPMGVMRRNTIIWEVRDY